MILSTHAIVGGAIAYLLPTHPALVAVAGFASHFAIDAIPHWDYSLRSISIGKNADNRELAIDRRFLLDIAVMGLDACAGLAIALFLFSPHAAIWVIALGATAGMLPDALQFVYTLFPQEPLKTLQRFHGWIHSKRKLDRCIGILSQAAFAAGVSSLVLFVF